MCIRDSLGNSLEEIAAHKTGICKPGCQVVSMRQKEAAQKVVEQTAAELGCMLTIADVANAKHVKYGLKKQTFDYGNYKKLEITLEMCIRDRYRPQRTLKSGLP